MPMTNETAIAAATWNSDAPRWPRSRALVTKTQSRTRDLDRARQQIGRRDE